MPANTSAGWVQLYHKKQWSNLLDVLSFLVEVCAALAGLSALVYLIYTTLKAFVSPASDTAQQPGLTALFSFAAGGLLAYWGIQGMRHFLRDALQPVSIFEGQAERVEVTWVTTSRNGYHQWTLFADGQVWSIPTPPVSLKVGIQAGTRFRLRYRAGTRTVTDVWVLHARHRAH